MSERSESKGDYEVPMVPVTSAIPLIDEAAFVR